MQEDFDLHLKDTSHSYHKGLATRTTHFLCLLCTLRMQEDFDLHLEECAKPWYKRKRFWKVAVSVFITLFFSALGVGFVVMNASEVGAESGEQSMGGWGGCG